MKLRYSIAASLMAISAATVIAAPAQAQQTTSAVRGTVVSATGPVAGADVTVTHVPSGTTQRTTTDGSGNFSANGLRVGGPFTVEISAGGFEPVQVTDLFLEAGQPFRLPIEMQEEAIVVTASALRGTVATSNGPVTALDRTAIEGAASLNRDIRDLARRDPLVSLDLTNSRAIEVAGNNGRLNRFSVDGVQFSDDFGLNNGGLPTARGPVPFDAIEQFSVKVAPYDIAEGDFQGGAVNVVLRSGGNRFHGGAFFSYTDDNLTGSRSRGNNVTLDFDSKQYGGYLSGPIIKDKLFFMLAYERTKESDPFDDGFGPGFANQIPGLTQAVVDLVSQTAQSRYGYDTLGLSPNAVESDEKLIGKLDWNINDKHRASLTYIRNVGTQQSQQNTFTNPPYSLGFQSNGYELGEEVNTGIFELNSNWSSRFSTQVRVSYRDYNRSQTPFGSRDFPQFDVCTDAVSGGSSSTSCTGTSLVFGPDISRHSNALNTENLSVDFTARLDAGDHALRFLAGYTDVTVFNLFLQRSLGHFYFDSIADFLAGNVSRLRYGNAVPSLDPDDAAAQFGTQNYTIGLQDDWQITPDLTLSAGVRYDLFGNDARPPLNPNFLARYGYHNRETFNGRSVVQPRVGFNWKPSDRLIVRGGVGIFAGGTPDVYLSNVFSNTGQLTNSIDIRPSNCATSATCDALTGITSGAITQSVKDYLATNIGSLAAAQTDNIDPNLKLARKLKTSLQVDYEADLGTLGDGWLFGAQFLYDKNIYGYQWTDLRSVPTGAVLPDGRPAYGPFGGSATTNRDLQLTNSKKGRGYFATARFAKSWDFGLSIDGSYTYSNVKDVAAMTSSTSSSNYGNNIFVDPNFAAYGRSLYEFRHQWKFGFDFKREFFGDNETRFSLFGEYRSGRPYSVTMLDNSGGRGAVFGTVGNLGSMALYVPNLNDNSKVDFDTPASEANFNALVSALGLEKYRGRIVPKNSQRSPDFFKVDLHVSQEIPALVGNAKFKLFADVENVLNLIDSDWGALRQVSFPYAASLVEVSCITDGANACAKYLYSEVEAPNTTLVTRQSLYGVRVGVKVNF